MGESGEVITIRVPKGTRAFVRRQKIKLGVEVRELIKAKMRTAALLKEFSEIERRARTRKVHGDSTAMIRADRDSR